MDMPLDEIPRRESRYSAQRLLTSPETAAALCDESQSELPSERLGLNSVNECKRWRIPEGGQYWPDGQDCPKSLHGSSRRHAMRTGDYDVYHNGNRAERIHIVVDGHKVTITGPRWNGRGVVFGVRYTGIAVCPLGTEAYHHAVTVGDALYVEAFFPRGTVDWLEWHPVEENVGTVHHGEGVQE